jgi:large subunit ribosomal protein L4
MADLKVITQGGRASGSMELPDAVFAREPNPALLHEVVVRELAGLRQGTHAVKTRGNVSGGGRKPWRQKGTGRARHGSTRSPLWKGGGVVFGPQPRNHGYRMPRKKVRAALEVALSDALREERIVCLKEIKLKAPKTKDFVKFLQGVGAEGNTLVVVDEIAENLDLAARNVPTAVVIEASDLTPYDVVIADRLVFAKAALEGFGEVAGGETDDA